MNLSRCITRMWLFLIFAVASSVAAAASPADNADWWYVSNSGAAPARVIMYVDRASIKTVERGRVQVVVFTISEKPTSIGTSSLLTHYLIDCRKRTSAFLEIMGFDDQGKQIGTERYDSAAAVPIGPETNLDGIRRHVCRDRPLPSFSVSNPVQHAMRAWGQSPDASAAEASSDAPASGYGTGFFVNSAGEIATSYHVVEGAKNIVVYTAEREALRASVVRSSAVTDLVVLHVDHKPLHYLTLAPPNSSHSGDKVFTFGFPVMEMLGSEPKYTDGAISSLSGIGNEAAFAQISVPVQPGNSGGPLVNEQGGVVGVIAAQVAIEEFAAAADTLPQNVNWAVRSEYLAPLIGRASLFRPLSREQAVALARKAVVVVVAER